MLFGTSLVFIRFPSLSSELKSSFVEECILDGVLDKVRDLPSSALGDMPIGFVEIGLYGSLPA